MTTQNKNTPAAPPPAQTPVSAMQKFFEKDTVKDQLQRAVAENQDLFIASVVDLYSSDTYLQKCSPERVVMEALKAAVMKLPINKQLGYAYVVPYKKGDALLPQLQIGYKGMIQLAIRTNQYRVINADVVYEGEYVKANKITGEFDLTGQKKSDKVIGYFAHFEMKNGFSKTLYMTKEQVTRHAEKYSKSFKESFSPWKTEFDAMAKKTLVRGLFSHWGYMSIEMGQAFTDDDVDQAEKTMNEFKSQGNRTEAGFDDIPEADVVEEKNNPPY